MRSVPPSCAACGADLTDDSRFCRRCGQPVVDRTTDSPHGTEELPKTAPGGNPRPHAPEPPAAPPPATTARPAAPPLAAAPPPSVARPIHPPVLPIRAAATGAPADSASAPGAAPRKVPFPPVTSPTRRSRWPWIAAGAVGLLLLAAVAGAALRLRGGGGTQDAAAPIPIDTPTPEIALSATPLTISTIPAGGAALSPTPSPSPTASATPGPRTVNGLLIVDETWVGRVREAGGLRIRSAPRVEAGNVVGSVATGAQVTVEGRVLNGQEAEAGKGTVWLIVGPNQYIYAADGYVERAR